MTRTRALLTALILSSIPMGTHTAMAFSDYCWVEAYPAFHTDDTCGPVPASSGHFIYYSVSPFLKYWVRDINLNVFIRWGNAGSLGKHETVFGLTNWYELRIKGPAGSGYINNT